MWRRGKLCGLGAGKRREITALEDTGRGEPDGEPPVRREERRVEAREVLRRDENVLADQEDARDDDAGAEEDSAPRQDEDGIEESERGGVEERRGDERAASPETHGQRAEARSPVERLVLETVEDVEARDPEEDREAEEDRQEGEAARHRDPGAHGRDREREAEDEVRGRGEALRVRVAEDDEERDRREREAERRKERRGEDEDACGDRAEENGRGERDRAGRDLARLRARVFRVDFSVDDPVEGHRGGARSHHREEEERRRASARDPARREHRRQEREGKSEDRVRELDHREHPRDRCAGRRRAGAHAGSTRVERRARPGRVSDSTNCEETLDSGRMDIRGAPPHLGCGPPKRYLLPGGLSLLRKGRLRGPA